MKNRIWKKLSALGMAFFMTGMMVCGGVDVIVYAQEEPVILMEADVDNEEIEETFSEPVPDEIVELSDTEQITDNSGSQEDNLNNGKNESGTESNEENTSQNDETLSDGSSEEKTEENLKTAELAVRVETDEDTVKAGKDLVYTVILENTGEIMLKNIQLHYEFFKESMTGEWSGKKIVMEADTSENIARMESLDAGIKETAYLTVRIPEEQKESLSMKLTATAETDEMESENCRQIRKEIITDQEVIPLKAAVEVTKTADRSVAVPGDKILFQICIRNTGERTLHSVITTERFQLGNVPVEFLEKDGVVLNKSKTKAKIEKIAPGSAFGLQAIVTLPEDIKDQELLNEVTVTTQETGDQTVSSQAKVQIRQAEEKKEDSVDTDNEETLNAGESYPASSHPKTGDPYQPFLWLAMIPGSLLAAGWIRSKM